MDNMRILNACFIKNTDTGTSKTTQYLAFCFYRI